MTKEGEDLPKGVKYLRRDTPLPIVLLVVVLLIGICGVIIEGLPVIGGFQNVLVTSARVNPKFDKAYLEVGIPENIFPFHKIKVDGSNVEVKVDSSAPGTLVSTEDSLIWGRWPEVNQVLITVRTAELKEEWGKKLKARKEKPEPKDIVP